MSRRSAGEFAGPGMSARVSHHLAERSDLAVVARRRRLRNSHRHLPTQRGILRAVLAHKLLVLGDVVLHRVELVFLHAQLAGDEVLLIIAAAAGQHERGEPQQTQRRVRPAQKSRYRGAMIQGGNPTNRAMFRRHEEECYRPATVFQRGVQ